MNEAIVFFVEGLAIPAGSKKAVPGGARWYVVDINEKKLKPWSDLIKAEARQVIREPLEGPLRLSLRFGIKRPAGHLRVNGELNAEGLRRPFPTVRPDVLKLARAVEDALTEVAYLDDAQIVVEELAKFYTDSGELQGREYVLIEIQEVRP